MVIVLGQGRICNNEETQRAAIVSHAPSRLHCDYPMTVLLYALGYYHSRGYLHSSTWVSKNRCYPSELSKVLATYIQFTFHSSTHLPVYSCRLLIALF